MLTIRPFRPFAIIRRSTNRVRISGDVRFVWMMLEIWSADVCTCSESWPTAALLTMPSIGPSLASTSFTKAWPAASSFTSTEPACTWSGYFSASAVSSGVTVRANAATLTPCSIRSVTIARPRPREPPETRTTLEGGTRVGSDIALQRLLRRDFFQQLDPARHAVVRQPGAAPLDQVGVGGRAHGLVQHHFGGDHPADDRGFAREHPRPGDRRVRGQHVADQARGHLGAADVDLVAVQPAGDQDAAVDDRDPVAGPDRAVQSGAVVRGGDDQLVILDRQQRPVDAGVRLAVQPGDREPGLAVVHHDRGAHLGRGVDPGDPRFREHLPQPVQDRLVDRFAAERDLLQRHLGQRLAVAIDGLPPERRRTGCGGHAVLGGDHRPGIQLGRLDHDQVLVGERQRDRDHLPPGVGAGRVRAQPGALRLPAVHGGERLERVPDPLRPAGGTRGEQPDPAGLLDPLQLGRLDGALVTGRQYDGEAGLAELLAHRRVDPARGGDQQLGAVHGVVADRRQRVTDPGDLTQPRRVEVQLVADLVLDPQGELGEVQGAEPDLPQVGGVVGGQVLALGLHHLAHQVTDLGARQLTHERRAYLPVTACRQAGSRQPLYNEIVVWRVTTDVWGFRGVVAERLTPAAVVWVLAAVVLLRYDVGWADVVRFTVLLGAGIMLPGTLCWRALRGNTDGFAADVAFGTGLGCVVSMLVYLPARAAGVPLLGLAFPLGTVAAFLVVPRLRGCWRSAGPRVPAWWAWSVAGACVAGEPLRYHWFAYAELATMSWQSGIELDVLLHRLVPLLYTVLPVLGVAALATKLAARA